MENKAVFSLEKYYFSKVNIDLNHKNSNDLEILFEPSGKYISEQTKYELKFIFQAINNNSKDPFINIECIANFKFENVNTLDDIPSYFYRNSIAIVFPYLRAFISTVTLQANIPPVVLPTMNLSSLEKPLREHTTVS